LGLREYYNNPYLPYIKTVRVEKSHWLLLRLVSMPVRCLLKIKGYGCDARIAIKRLQLSLLDLVSGQRTLTHEKCIILFVHCSLSIVYCTSRVSIQASSPINDSHKISHLSYSSRIFPVLPFSTISSILDPKSTPISFILFLAQSPTFLESL